MVVLISGLPGTGKTFLASKLSIRLHAVHISSDKVRNEMLSRGRYDVNARQAVYDEMRLRMEDAILSGNNVVLDATFYTTEIRDLFLNTAASLNAKIYIVWMTADENQIKQRTSKPRPDSEADYQVYLKLKENYQPIQEPHLHVASDKLTLDQMIEKTIHYLGENDS